MTTAAGRTLALLGCLCWGGDVTAQEPADRRALERLRDSIAVSVDTAGLLALETAGIARARAERDEPMHHLRLGLIAMRLAELRPGAHLDDAIGEFEWAVELRPDWPWPWYGLGMAEARARNRAGDFAGGLWTMLGLDRDRRAGRAFARAVAADPTFVSGLVEFARVALEQRLDAPILPALEALREATASPIGWHPELLLARGRLERLVGEPDAARLAFQRSLLLGMRTDLVQLELARTLALLPTASPEAVASAYFAGAATSDREVAAMYRRDLEPIARDDELAAFDARGGAARAVWLRAFWQQLGARDLRDPDDRLVEHFRRWDVARRDFRLPPFRRRYRWGLEIYQSGDSELDDRGVIWLRHGPPSLRVEWPRVEYLRRPERRNFGNESWRYDRPEGPMVLHFVAHDDPQDYRAVDTPIQLDVPLWLLEARAHELPGLERMIRAGPATAGWVTEEVRLQGRASITIATETTAWERTYAGVLTGRAQWLAAGERNGQPLAHLIYAVDADSLRQLGARLGESAVPLRVRASFLGRDGSVVATLDTLHRVPVPSAGARLVAARVEVPVRPGLLRVRYGVEAGPDLGAVYPVDSIVAPRIAGRRLDASALLIGRERVSLPWQATPADTAWLDAGGLYPQGDTLTVYAEAYGVPAGEAVEVSLSLTRERTGLSRLLGGRRSVIALSERLTSPGGPLRIRRQLGLGEVAAGQYALELVVNAGGQRVVRRRGLTIAP
jgi:hypothetical protein